MGEYPSANGAGNKATTVLTIENWVYYKKGQLLYKISRQGEMARGQMSKDGGKYTQYKKEVNGREFQEMHVDIWRRD